MARVPFGIKIWDLSFFRITCSDARRECARADGNYDPMPLWQFRSN